MCKDYLSERKRTADELTFPSKSFLSGLLSINTNENYCHWLTYIVYFGLAAFSDLFHL